MTTNLFADTVMDQGPTKRQSASKFVSSVWSFPGSGGDQLYRWYGTLPRALIERLFDLYVPSVGGRFVDFFLGLGVSLEIAADRGADGWGLDANPLACLATTARLRGRPEAPSLLHTLERVRRATSAGEAQQSPFVEQFLQSPRYSYARKWFRDDTLRAVLALLAAIGNIKDEQEQRLAFIGAAQAIREVASVDPRCTHHLVRKEKPFIDPVGVWARKTLVASRAARERPVVESRTRVHQGSALDCNLSGQQAHVALVHPPYLGVIHYNQIHRLATDLLDYVSAAHPQAASLGGLTFDHDRLRELDMSTDNETRYRRFIGDLAPRLTDSLVPNGVCVVIIGDQRYQGRLRHPMTDFVVQLEAAGFLLEETFIWVLQNNGGMHVLRRGHFIDHNYVLVFRKQAALPL